MKTWLVLSSLLAFGAVGAERAKPSLDCGGGLVQITEQPVPPTHRRSPETCAAWRKAMATLKAAEPKTSK